MHPLECVTCQWAEYNSPGMGVQDPSLFLARCRRASPRENWQCRSIAPRSQVQCLLAVANKLNGTSRRASHQSSSESGAFRDFFPCNHFINIKNKKNSFIGEVKDSVIFAFYFLLHKLHKRAKPTLRPLPPPSPLTFSLTSAHPSTLNPKP